MFAKLVIVLVLFVCLTMAGGSARVEWCQDPAGRKCKHGGGGVVAVLAYEGQEDEDLAQEYEQDVTVLRRKIIRHAAAGRNFAQISRSFAKGNARKSGGGNRKSSGVRRSGGARKAGKRGGSKGGKRGGHKGGKRGGNKGSRGQKRRDRRAEQRVKNRDRRRHRRVPERPHDTHSRSVTTFTAKLKEYFGDKKFECLSDCRWIRNHQTICDQCKFPFALYNETENQGSCVGLTNIWGLMRDNQHALAAYADRCVQEAECKCGAPETPNFEFGNLFGNNSFMVQWATEIANRNASYCQYNCSEFLVDLEPKYMALYEALRDEVDQVRVTIDKRAFTKNETEVEKCPSRSSVEEPMEDEQKEALAQYCFWIAKDKHIKRRNLTEEQFDAMADVWNTIFKGKQAIRR